jgi:predicted kinase
MQPHETQRADRDALSYADLARAAQETLRRAATMPPDEEGLTWPADQWGAAFATARLLANAPGEQAAQLAHFGMEALVARHAALAAEDRLGRARARTLAAAITELRARGRPGAAAALASVVCEQSGDEGLSAIVPLLAALEALMTCGLAATAGVRGRPLLRLYWRLALATAQAASAGPAIIVCGGLSGSGKSFVARGVGSVIGARVIAADVERKRLAGLVLTQRTPDERRDEVYSVATSDRVYRQLLDDAEHELRAGRPVVLDATYLTRLRRQPALDLAARRGVPALLLWCVLGDAEASLRLSARAAQGWTISDGDSAVRAGQQAGMEEPVDGERGARVISVDTALSPAGLMRTLLPRVQRALRTGPAV